MVALAQGAAHRRQGLRLGAALDALRDRRDPDLLGEPQDGLTIRRSRGSASIARTKARSTFSVVIGRALR